MKRRGWITVGIILFAATAFGQRQTSSTTTDEPLITGRRIADESNSRQRLGNMPMSIAVEPNGKFALVGDMGYHQSLWTIDMASAKEISHFDFPNRLSNGKPIPEPAGETASETAPPKNRKTNGFYTGLVINGDKTVYAAQGGNDSIAILSLSPSGKLSEVDRIITKKRDFPSGLAIDNRGHLFVANNAAGEGNPFDFPGSVAVYDVTTKIELGRSTFTDSHGGTSNFPLAIAVLRDGSKAYVAAERDDCIYVLDTSDPSKPRIDSTMPTGARPVSLLLTKDGRTLYVANSLSDTVSIIDTKSDRSSGTILLRPSAVRDLAGASPTALCLSPDEKTLYVTLGDMNSVAVVDLATQEVSGYVPTGWYPSALAVSGDGKRLLVANAKGSRVRNPNNKRDPHDPQRKSAYILSLLEGDVGIIEVPDNDSLHKASDEVLKNNRLDNISALSGNSISPLGEAAGKIKHVIYVIKENRTYDQVLGDLKQGNGDPSLVLFGRDITPNQHALAERFVLLDNLYACGEVSGDGWVWSTQGMANAYVVRNVPYNYSSRGRAFDFEGANNDYPTGGLPKRNIDDKGSSSLPPFRNGLPAIPDVASTGRNLWDAAKHAGVPLRNYGFYLYSGDSRVGFDNYPNSSGLQPPGHDLEGISDIDFRRFDMEYPDSDAPSTISKSRATQRVFSAPKPTANMTRPAGLQNGIANSN